MSKLVLVALAVLVAVCGFVLFKSDSDVDVAPNVTPEEQVVDEQAAEDDGSEVEDSAPAASAPAVTTPPPAPTPAPAVEDTAAEVDDVLSDFGSLLEEDYDDSDLDASFEDNLDQSYGF